MANGDELKKDLDHHDREVQNAYIEKIATDAARKQIAWIGSIMAMVVAFASFLGYQQLLSNVEAKAKAEVDQKVEASINVILANGFDKTVKDRITEKTVADLTPTVRNRVDAVIDSQCANVARVDKRYGIESANSPGWILADDVIPGASRAPVYTTGNNKAAVWKLVPER